MSHANSSPKPAREALAKALASEPKFEAVIPWESALELVSLVRSGKLFENRVRAIQLAAWVAGCTATTIGEREKPVDDVVVQGVDLTQLVHEAQGYDLATCCDKIEAMATGTNAAALFDPQLIALILQILKLISELRG